MKAVVYRGPKKMKPEDVPEPEPAQNEVLVRFKAGSICGTDIHYYRGEWKSLKIGRIIGHDASGQIMETAQRAAIVPFVSCGACRYCLEGRPNVCEKWSIMGFNRDGCFSELIAVPRENLLPIPNNVTYEEAAILEPVALALHTFDLLQPRFGQWATIVGQGPIGLVMTQVARASGCRVIAIDLEDYRLAISENYGAEVCINPKSQNVVEKVRTITDGGSGIVVEAAGKKETVEQTSKLVSRTGKVALVGESSGTMKFEGEATFFGVWLNPLKYALALDSLSKGIIDVRGLITHRFPLTDFERAIETATDTEKSPVKVILQEEH
ncbi:MAG: zinc-binding dehydrogenase [Promethearchaeota archaeon]